MKTIIRLLSFFLFVVPLTANSQGIAKEQSFIVNNNDTIIAAISQREITRIAFESEVIFIFSIEGELEYTTKDQDLYLRPNVEKPINFFVKTADEHTYKFIVKANDIPAIQIFIKSNRQQNTGNNKLVLYGKHNIPDNLQKKISKLIDIALKPKAYLGFSFKEANEYLGTINDISLQKIAEVEGLQLKAEIIMITNESNESKTLNFLEFMNKGITAVYTEKLSLKAGEKTKLIRIKGYNETDIRIIK